MDIYMFLCIVCIIYGMLAFFDYFFHSCMMLPYIEFIKSSGITVKVFRIQWYTTGFNRTIAKYSTKMPSLYRNSFKVGVYVTMALAPIALIMVILSLFTGVSSASTSPSATGVQDIAHLEILLPGVNLPLNEFGYYIIALLICSVVHEAGHGIASVLEEIPVVGFGLHLMFLIPIAYTEIDNDQLQTSKLWKKLKIYSAGIWNNIILAGWAYIALLMMPIILSPMYTTDESIIITQVKLKAPIAGDNGLHIDDIIASINGCPVTSEEDWYRCLSLSITHHPAYCVHEDFVRQNDESIHEAEHQKDGTINCCSSNPTLNCFENFDDDRLPQYICLNIRNTIEHSEHYCQETSCPSHTSCLKPSLANTTTIIHMKRTNRQKDLIYYGHPLDVLRNVEISEFVPKTKHIRSWLADAICLMLKYLTVFSSGLAIVNVVPCYGLDGQFLINAIIANLPMKYFSKNQKETIAFSINLVGTITLFLAILKIIWTTFT